MLRSSPFGSQAPAIPTARSVTIARVASPITVDRFYQPLFLRALKTHLHATKRLVKQGDLIAVPICTDDAKRLNDLNAGDSGEDPLDYKYVLRSVNGSRRDQL